jgi:DNA-binding transcriptional regulator YiaG
MAKLTVVDVRFIRRHTEMRQVELATLFQVTQATISNVITRRTYKQVA